MRLFRRKWSRGAALLALLAFACAAGAFVVVSGYARKLEALRPAVGAPVPIVVAAADIARGAQLTAAMVEVATIPSAFAPPGALREPSEVEGRILLAPLAAGEVVTATRLASPRAGPVAALVPPGFRAFVVAAALPPRAVHAGDRVDVLATYGGPRPYTDTVAEGVEVLQVITEAGAVSFAGPAPAEAGARLVLLVAPDLAERLAHASVFGDLTVAIAPAEEPPTG